MYDSVVGWVGQFQHMKMPVNVMDPVSEDHRRLFCHVLFPEKLFLNMQCCYIQCEVPSDKEIFIYFDQVS